MKRINYIFKLILLFIVLINVAFIFRNFALENYFLQPSTKSDFLIDSEGSLQRSFIYFNKGVAYDILSNSVASIFIVQTIFVFFWIILGIWFWKKTPSYFIIFIIAGAIFNITDRLIDDFIPVIWMKERIFRQKNHFYTVVDYFSFNKISFNIADCFILFGIVGVLATQINKKNILAV